MLKLDNVTIHKQRTRTVLQFFYTL